MTYNKVILAGFLTKDPELKYTPNGTAICNLSIALNRKYKQGDEFKTEVTYVNNIAVWGKQGENCAEYLNKGEAVIIDGRLQSQSWEDKQGNKREQLKVIAEKVQFINSKKKTEKQDQDVSSSNSDDLPF
ncbi:MAG: single-stranded DNA-binding protein [Candidatus Thorarchaeota archaeon]